jgi:hypothetical protein
VLTICIYTYILGKKIWHTFAFFSSSASSGNSKACAEKPSKLWGPPSTRRIFAASCSRQVNRSVQICFIGTSGNGSPENSQLIVVYINLLRLTRHEWRSLVIGQQGDTPALTTQALKLLKKTFRAIQSALTDQKLCGDLAPGLDSCELHIHCTKPVRQSVTTHPLWDHMLECVQGWQLGCDRA